MPLVRVPYIPQQSPTASRYYADCGPACAAMVLAWAGRSTPTVDQLSDETTLKQGSQGVDQVQIMDLLIAHGLSCRIQAGTTIPQIEQEINADRPVIAFMLRSGLGHCVVVNGYDANGFFVQDPASPFNRMSRPALSNAMDLLTDGRQCIFITDTPISLTGKAIVNQTVNARLAPNGRIVGQLRALEAVEVISTEDGISRIVLTVPSEFLRKA
jgi:uncharacterized protein YvpB